MSLSAGTRLGPYEILDPIGAGGMGEVYRARDARLGRDVALKVLPQAVANDPDRLARFTREARAVAALSHPNILSLHDFDAADGVPYAVMELLVGQTIRERLQAGPLPSRKSVDIAIQIARGLAAAHAKGLVHRDLKPENVFLLADGQVKILDFGLARDIASPSGTGATETIAHTDPGVVMGTVGYMAPEQVRGAPVDARADLFTLGAVLYEMLSGRRAFQRDTAAETMTAILNQDPPPLADDRHDLSPALERVVLHCLEKNPTERFQTAQDAAFALEGAVKSGSSPSAAAVVPAKPARRLVGIGVLALLLIAAAFGLGALVQRWWTTPAAAVTALTQKTFDVQKIHNARFFPDGRTIIHDGARQGPYPDLFAIRPDRLDSEMLAKGAALLAVSSTGEMAVLTKIFGSQFNGVGLGTLARVTSGTAPREVLSDVRCADWSPTGDALAAVHRVDGRERVEYPLGTVLFESDGWISDLRVSPRGDRVAFVDHFSGGDPGRVTLVDREKRVTTLTGELDAIFGLAWTHDESAILFSANDDGARPVDRQLRSVSPVAGAPVRSFAPIPGGLHVLDVAPTGAVLAMQPGNRAGIRAMVPGAASESELSWRDASLFPVLSRDGTFVAFTDFRSSTAQANASVWLRRTDGSPPERLGEGYVAGSAPSPDGQFVLGGLVNPLRVLIYPTGIGTPVTVPLAPVEVAATADWFPDSRHVLVCGRAASGSSRCYRVDIKGGPLTPATPEGVTAGFVSPDGRSLLVKHGAGVWGLLSIETGRVTAAAGLRTADENILGWSVDGRAVFTTEGMLVPARLERIELTTGARTLVKEVAPPDRSGVTHVLVANVIDDGRGYAYTYTRSNSTLFLIEGLLPSK